MVKEQGHWSIPRGEAKIIERAIEERKRLIEQRKEIEKFVLPISLPDYAASQGRNPTDYELQGLYEFGSAKSYYQAQTKALITLNERRIETGCEVVVDIRFDSVATQLWSMPKVVEVGAMGIGLRLKTG